MSSSDQQRKRGNQVAGGMAGSATSLNTNPPQSPSTSSSKAAIASSDEENNDHDATIANPSTSPSSALNPFGIGNNNSLAFGVLKNATKVVNSLLKATIGFKYKVVINDGFQFQYALGNHENIMASAFHIKGTSSTSGNSVNNGSSGNNNGAALVSNSISVSSKDNISVESNNGISNTSNNNNTNNNTNNNNVGDQTSNTSSTGNATGPSLQLPVFIALNHDAFKLTVFDTSRTNSSSSSLSGSVNNAGSSHNGTGITGSTSSTSSPSSLCITPANVNYKLLDPTDVIRLKRPVRSLIHLTRFNFYASTMGFANIDLYNTRFELIRSFHTPDLVLILKYVNVSGSSSSNNNSNNSNNNNNSSSVSSNTAASSTTSLIESNYDIFVSADQNSVTVWRMSYLMVKSDPKISIKEERKILVPDENGAWIKDLYIDDNERIYVIFDYRIHILDRFTGETVRNIENPYFRPITSVFFHSDHRYLLAGFKDGCIKIWNTSFVIIHHFTGHVKSVTALARYPYEGYLISTSLDATVRMWNLTNFSEIYHLNIPNPIHNLTVIDKSNFYLQLERSFMVWSFNHFHSEFICLSSDVKSISIIKHQEDRKQPTTGGRLLVPLSDGSIYLISPVNGAILTSSLPVGTGEVSDIIQVAHSIPLERIYVLQRDKSVLVLSTRTNPCLLVDAWNNVISIQEDCISMAVYDQYPRNAKVSGNNSSVNNNNNSTAAATATTTTNHMLFCGTRNGQILSFDRNGELHYRFQLCNSPIVGLCCVSRRDLLLATCKDNTIRMVKITCPNSITNNNSTTATTTTTTTNSNNPSGAFEALLTPKGIINCGDNTPRLLSAMNSTICIGFDEGIIHICNDFESKVVPIPKTDHTDKLTSISNKRKLGIFATASLDGSIKTWNSTNTMLREMRFNSSTPMHSVCLINEHADLLFSLGNRIQVVKGKTHLPPAMARRLPPKKKRNPEHPIPINSYQDFLRILNGPPASRTAFIEQQLGLNGKQCKFMQDNLKASCFGQQGSGSSAITANNYSGNSTMLNSGNNNRMILINNNNNTTDDFDNLIMTRNEESIAMDDFNASSTGGLRRKSQVGVLVLGKKKHSIADALSKNSSYSSPLNSIEEFKNTLMKMHCEEDDYQRLKNFVLSLSLQLNSNTNNGYLNNANNIKLDDEDINILVQQAVTTENNAIVNISNSGNVNEGLNAAATTDTAAHLFKRTLLLTTTNNTDDDNNGNNNFDDKYVEKFVSNYKKLLERLDVNIREFASSLGKAFVPVAPDGSIPNSITRASIYHWLYKHGMLTGDWISSVPKNLRDAFDQREEKAKAERMMNSLDYRNKLARLLATLPTNINEGGSGDKNGGALDDMDDDGIGSAEYINLESDGKQHRRGDDHDLPHNAADRIRRRNKMHLLSEKAREALRKRVEQTKKIIATTDVAPNSINSNGLNGNIMNNAQPSSSNTMTSIIPQYIKRALERNIVKEEQIYNMEGAAIHKKLKIDPTPDGLLPFLIDVFEKGDVITRAEILNFLSYVNREFGFRNLNILLEYLCHKQILEHLDERSVDPTVNVGSELKLKHSILSFIRENGKNSLDALETVILLMGSKSRDMRDKAREILTEWGLEQEKQPESNNNTNGNNGNNMMTASILNALDPDVKMGLLLEKSTPPPPVNDTDETTILIQEKAQTIIQEISTIAPTNNESNNSNNINNGNTNSSFSAPPGASALSSSQGAAAANNSAGSKQNTINMLVSLLESNRASKGHELLGQWFESIYNFNRSDPCGKLINELNQKYNFDSTLNSTTATDNVNSVNSVNNVGGSNTFDQMSNFNVNNGSTMINNSNGNVPPGSAVASTSTIGSITNVNKTLKNRRKSTLVNNNSGNNATGSGSNSNDNTRRNSTRRNSAAATARKKSIVKSNSKGSVINDVITSAVALSNAIINNANNSNNETIGQPQLKSSASKKSLTNLNNSNLDNNNSEFNLSHGLSGSTNTLLMTNNVNNTGGGLKSIGNSTVDLNGSVTEFNYNEEGNNGNNGSNANDSYYVGTRDSASARMRARLAREKVLNANRELYGNGGAGTGGGGSALSAGNGAAGNNLNGSTSSLGSLFRGDFETDSIFPGNTINDTSSYIGGGDDIGSLASLPHHPGNNLNSMAIFNNSTSTVNTNNILQKKFGIGHKGGGGANANSSKMAAIENYRRKRMQELLSNPRNIIEELNRYAEYQRAMSQIRLDFDARKKEQEAELARREEERLQLEKVRAEREAVQRMVAEMLAKEEAIRREEEAKRKNAAEAAERKKQQDELRRKLDSEKAEREKQARKLKEEMERRSSHVQEQNERQRVMLEKLNERLLNLTTTDRPKLELQVYNSIAMLPSHSTVLRRQRRQLLPIDRVNVDGYFFYEEASNQNQNQSNNNPATIDDFDKPEKVKRLYFQPDSSIFPIPIAMSPEYNDDAARRELDIVLSQGEDVVKKRPVTDYYRPKSNNYMKSPPKTMDSNHHHQKTRQQQRTRNSIQVGGASTNTPVNTSTNASTNASASTNLLQYASSRKLFLPDMSVVESSTSKKLEDDDNLMKRFSLDQHPAAKLDQFLKQQQQMQQQQQNGRNPSTTLDAGEIEIIEEIGDMKNLLYAADNDDDDNEDKKNNHSGHHQRNGRLSGIDENELGFLRLADGSNLSLAGFSAASSVTSSLASLTNGADKAKKKSLDVPASTTAIPSQPVMPIKTALKKSSSNTTSNNNNRNTLNINPNLLSSSSNYETATTNTSSARRVTIMAAASMSLNTLISEEDVNNASSDISNGSNGMMGGDSTIAASSGNNIENVSTTTPLNH